MYGNTRVKVPRTPGAGDSSRILFESRPQFDGARGASDHPAAGAAQMRRLCGGPGVTSPKSRPSGCRADHAGYESFPSVLPDPFWASRTSWRNMALETWRLRDRRASRLVLPSATLRSK
jgi:hypothetical protein